MTDWIEYRDAIPIEKIQRICEEASELEEAKKIVEDDIRRGFVYYKNFNNMQEFFERLVHRLISTIRSFAKTAQEKELEKFESDLRNLIAWTESDIIRIGSELKGDTGKYAFTNLYVGKVNRLLYGYIEGVLEDTIMYAKSMVMKEFVMSLLRRRGISVSPAFIKELEEKAKPVEAV